MPYVIGQWVRGEQFYGRESLLDEILRGNRNCIWLLGTRRIGKTSVLKQIEQLTSGAADSGYFPLYWSFESAEVLDELQENLFESFVDASPRLEQLGIALEALQADDVFGAIGRLRSELRERRQRLLLLCDEVEELITLSRSEPRLLPRLRRALPQQEQIRTVLASKITLWERADREMRASSFLMDFSPPIYLRGLGDADARALIRQEKLPADARPRLDDPAVESIRERCSNHPFLLQLLCERRLALGELERAVEEIATDQTVSLYFDEDFKMLSEAERRVIRAIGEMRSASMGTILERLAADSDSLGTSLTRLEHLGYIQRNSDGEYALLNYFFRRWFTELPTADRAELAEVLTTASRRSVTHGAALSELLDGRYELQALIGRGASGRVYKAHDRELRVDIAIKVLKDEYAADSDAVERFRREVVLARGIAHPNVVRIYHFGESAGRWYLTMEWMDGPTLAQVIGKEAPLDDARTALIGARLASALEAAHRCRVLHRDIKPQNILIDRNGEPHITDFGLARLVGAPGVTSHDGFRGTPYYASPEQAESRELDPRSDVYSLGIVLFEMATGRRPFSASSLELVLRQHVLRAPPRPEALRPGISPELSRAILRCLEKDPAQRYQSAGELEQALRATAG